MNAKSTLLALMALVAVAAAPAPTTDALHFGLQSSVPAKDAEVTSPDEIRLTFTQVPQESSVSVRLIDSAGDAVETGGPTYDASDRKIIHVAVEATLPPGTYTVAWRGIGDDGHVVRGDFAFTVTAQ